MMAKYRPGGRALARLANFLRDTRAGAVGLPSVLIGMMCFTGIAMISDHTVLFHNRNILDTAAAAASLATTQRMSGLSKDLTDEEVVDELTPLAKRYILANLPQGVVDSVRDTLEVTLSLDRDIGIVGIKASAEMGGAIVGRHLWGSLIEKTEVKTGAERIMAPVDLVLAIDVTGSMKASIHTDYGGNKPPSVEAQRITVVRNAMRVLVAALYDQEGGTEHVSVGLVPFNTTVNIGADRTGWVSDLGSGHKIIPEGFGPWQGCIEHRTGEKDLSLDRPGDEPFTSWFFPSTLEFRPVARHNMQMDMWTSIGWHDVRGENEWEADNPHEGYFHSPHYACPRDEIIPLTTDRAVIEQAITDLQPWDGGGTMTHLGVVWGRRLLADAWREDWNLPEQRTELGKTKALVLLTDGLNAAYDSRETWPGLYRHNRHWSRPEHEAEYISEYTGYGRVGVGTVEEGFRMGTRLDSSKSDADELKILDAAFLESCQRAKDDGITVFTVSAVPKDHPRLTDIREDLVACATSEDHAFVENSNPEGMKEAFRSIGQLVAAVRRVM